MAMAQRRTDLAVEAHELWREGAGETTKLSGVRAEDGQREGFSTTVVTVLDQEGAAALGKPVGRYVTLELDGLVRREEDAFQRAVRRPRPRASRARWRPWPPGQERFW